ncbi:MAG TPA: ParB/RepB/Spo0J family partition protein [Candidatus Faecaligallichristensenella faecipullorum]|nr:ParB/RepB/Spo0J family partition protein [Candidatus Faecaligallichristensenella faecipullorum]
MTKHRGLGRGLDALLGGDAFEEVEAQVPAARAQETVREIKLGDIDPNPGQPRKSFSQQALEELAESIRSVGVIQPILLARSGRRYTIVAGERRWRAARLAGLDVVPAIVREWDELKRLEIALIENLQRDDLNPVDEAMGIQSLMEQCGLTQEQAAQRLGKSRPAVANALRLLALPEPILDMLKSGKLSAGHGRALVPLSKDRQLALAQLAAAQGWSVRQLERACQMPAQNGKKPAQRKEPEMAELERMAREVFGTKASISGTPQKGKLVLQYYNPDDLQRIWELLEFMRQSQ